MEFGERMKTNFLLANGYSMINHGSWGAVPKQVFDYRMKLIKEHEALPELFYRKTLFEEQEKNSEAIAKFVGAEPNSVALTDNTTFGVNSSIMSAPLSEGDSILVQSFTYKATECAARRIAEQKGFLVRKLDVKLPIKSDEDIVQLYADELEKYPDIRMIILDHISSSVPILWPVEKLMNLFRSYDVIVLIDGAHAPGQVSVCLDELQPDYYVASLHKWNFVPRSCGLLYVADGRQESMYNIISSYNYKLRPFQKRFHTIGTRDYSSLFCWKESREFVEKCGGLSKIIEHNKELNKAAATLLVKAWDTKLLEVPDCMRAPFMSLIKLPKINKFSIPKDADKVVFMDFDELIVVLRDRFKICAPVFTIYGEPWLRISCQIYNTLADYEVLRDAILTLMKEDEN